MRPDPTHGFNDDGPRGSDHDGGDPFPGEWEPPACLPKPSAPPATVEEWLAMHAGKPFVAVGGPVTVKPKF